MIESKGRENTQDQLFQPYEVELPVTDGEEELVDDRPRALSEHLQELRMRLAVCTSVWLLLCGFCYSRADWLLQHIRHLAGNNFSFVYTGPTEAFMAFVKLSMTAAFIAVLPLILYEVAAFCYPGLTKREKRWMWQFVPLAFLLFVGGALFAWYVALPTMWRFFLSFQGEGIRALWTIGDVVGFVVGLLLICGCIFELPLVMLFASALGLVKRESLRASRRYIYFGSVIVAAIATPTPDAFTCAVVALPLVVLFEFSLLIMRFTEKSTPTSDGLESVSQGEKSA